MRTWPDADGGAIRRFLQQLRLRHPRSAKSYRSVLSSFQHFVTHHEGAPSRTTIEAWLRADAACRPVPRVLPRARTVNRFLDFLVTEGSLASNPLRQLRACYGQRTAPIMRALLTAAPDEALDALRPIPRFGSFLGGLMRQHVALMRAMGYRYRAQETRFLRFDRFLQGRPDLMDQPPAELMRQWAAASPRSGTRGSAKSLRAIWPKRGVGSIRA